MNSNNFASVKSQQQCSMFSSYFAHDMYGFWLVAYMWTCMQLLSSGTNNCSKADATFRWIMPVMLIMPYKAWPFTS